MRLTREVECEIFNIQQAAVDATEKRGGTRQKRAPQGRALCVKGVRFENNYSKCQS